MCLITYVYKFFSFIGGSRGKALGLTPCHFRSKRDPRAEVLRYSISGKERPHRALPCRCKSVSELNGFIILKLRKLR